jgi:SNF2 family DNA or RNA helicase
VIEARIRIPDWLAEKKDVPSSFTPRNAIAQSDKAICLDVQGENVWFPKSQISFEHGRMSDVKAHLGDPEDVDVETIDPVVQEYARQMEQERREEGYQQDWLFYHLQGKFDQISKPEARALADDAREQIDQKIFEERPALDLSQDLGKCALKYPRKNGDAEMHEYQKKGTAGLVHAGSAILADTMGLGKTVQAIAAAENTDRKPVLVVCPNIKLNWRDEIKKWLDPLTPTQIVHGQKGRLLVDEWTIINYAIMHDRLNQLTKVDWGTIILDESHYISNPESLRSEACLDLIDELDSDPNVYCLTGTPIRNDASDLWAQLKAIGHPIADLGYERFRKKFGSSNRAQGKGSVSASDLDGMTPQLSEQINDSWIRRVKSEVHDELPDLTRDWHEIKITREFERKYEVAVERFKREYQEKKQEDMGHILGKLNNLRKIATKAKTEPIAQFGKQVIDEHDKQLIIFSFFLDSIEMFAQWFDKHGISYRVYSGDTPDSERDQYRKEFNAGKFDVLLATEAGEEGINLQAGDEVWFASLGWTPTQHAQCECRSWRIGREKKVISRYFKSNLDIDHKMCGLLRKKIGHIEQVVDLDNETGIAEEQQNIESIQKELAKKVVIEG